MPADQFDRQSAVHDNARRLGIDPDVVFRGRRDVAFATWIAAHDHAAADVGDDRRLPRNGQRNIGQRTERDQNESRIRLDGLDDGIDRVRLLRGLFRRGIVVIAESVASVKPGCVLIGAKQRLRRARIDRNIRAAKFDGVESVARGLLTGTFPATTVIAATRTSGARKAMMSATASSEAVSVSMRNVRGTGKDSRGIPTRCVNCSNFVPLSTRSGLPSRLNRHCRSPNCLTEQRRVQLLVLQGGPHVHTAEFDDRAVDDGRQRGLLGIVGQYLQGREELSLRTFLLGLCDRHFSDFSGARAHAWAARDTIRRAF